MRTFMCFVSVKEQIEIEKLITFLFGRIVLSSDCTESLSADELKEQGAISFFFVFPGGESTAKIIREKFGKQDNTNPARDAYRTTFPEGFKSEEVVAYVYERVVQMLTLYKMTAGRKFCFDHSLNVKSMTFTWEKREKALNIAGVGIDNQLELERLIKRIFDSFVDYFQIALKNKKGKRLGKIEFKFEPVAGEGENKYTFSQTVTSYALSVDGERQPEETFNDPIIFPDNLDPQKVAEYIFLRVELAIRIFKYASGTNMAIDCEDRDDHPWFAISWIEPVN